MVFLVLWGLEGKNGRCPKIQSLRWPGTGWTGRVLPAGDEVGWTLEVVGLDAGPRAQWITRRPPRPAREQTSPGLTYPPPRAGTCSEPGMATAPPLTSWPKLIPYPLSGFQAAGWPPQTLLGCHSPKPTKNCQKSTCGRRIPPHPKKVRRTPREGTQPNLSTPKPQFAPSKPQPWLFPALRCKFEPQQLSRCSRGRRWNLRVGGPIAVARQHHHRRGRQQQFGMVADRY